MGDINKPLKILIVSEHASRKYGGEAMLPINYFQLLSETEHQVFLVTHARVKAEFEAYAELNHDNIFYIPDTFVHKVLYKVSTHIPERINTLTVAALMHFITQIYQWFLVRRVVQLHDIDVIHEPAPVSPGQPSVMFGLGVPVVIGPMNGGMSFPPGFKYLSSGFERLIYQFLRLFTTIYNVLLPGKLFATMLLVANSRTAAALPKLRLGKVKELVENGVFDVASHPRKREEKSRVQVTYVGRLVDWKMVDIAIKAVGQCKQAVDFFVIGDGPMRAQLENIQNLNSNNHVRFLGAVPFNEVNKHYDETDIFVLPSVRECGGAVVLEAMSRGVPVISTNWGGPADYIAPGCGVMVEPVSYAYMVEAFAKAIDDLASNPDLRASLSEAALKRVTMHYTWEKKIRDIIDIYQEAIALYSA